FRQRVRQRLSFLLRPPTFHDAGVQELRWPGNEGRPRLPAKPRLPVGHARQFASIGINREERRPGIGDELVAQRFVVPRFGEAILRTGARVFCRSAPQWYWSPDSARGRRGCPRNDDWLLPPRGPVPSSGAARHLLPEGEGKAAAWRSDRV